VIQSIIDAHHHIWRLSETPWLQGPPVPESSAPEGIRRDYTMRNTWPMHAERRRQVGVRQVNVTPGKEVQGSSGCNPSPSHGFPHAITAFADLRAPDVAMTHSIGTLPATRAIANSCIGMTSRSIASPQARHHTMPPGVAASTSAPARIDV
jgi:hypothetical protein